jgi:tetratricopeptide (TPR) repeat protein
MNRNVKIALAAALLLAAAAAFYVWRSGGKSVERPQPISNILLITIDTLRPDRLSCYGGSNPTPNLDRIAANGILFENAFCQVPLTFPSHTSILTGMYPIHHGVHQNGLEILNRRELLISRSMRQNGFRTGAVVSSFVLDRKFGLADDFDVYDDRMERKPGIVSNFDVERPANEVTKAAIKTIESFSGRRWFVWLHYYDPHTPYAPPSPYDGYDGEIRFVDQQIGILMQWLADRKLDASLAIAITGDHGESLGEHGEVTHGFFIYNSTVHVPMILSIPGGKPARIASPVATVDLAPTLLELAAISGPVKRDGRSLMAATPEGSPGRSILMESRYPELLGWNRLEGLLDERWKLISTTRSELYDWKADPSETASVFVREERISRKMAQQIQTYHDSEPGVASGPDPETLEKLKSLGYISTTTIAARGSADPKDKIAVWAKYEESLQLKNNGKRDEAIGILNALAQAEPDNVFFLTSLASDYRATGHPEMAIPRLQEAIRVDPRQGGAFQELALAYREMRNYPEAIKAIEAAITVEPHRSEFHSVLGLLLVDTGDFKRAEKEFDQVLRLDPNNAVAWNNAGNAFRAMGRQQEAADAYRRAIDLSPHYAYPLNGLATILIAQKNAREAIPLMEKALDLDPQFVEVYLNLGIAFHTLGEKEKARTCYRSFLKMAPSWMQQDRQNATLLLHQLS